MEENDSTWKECQQSIPSFLDKILRFASELGLDVSDLEIDHIGLRMGERELVDRLKKQIQQEGHIQISSAVVNERKIHNYELQEPIKHGPFSIACIELPYPSANHDYPVDGWEHAEFVIVSEAETIEEFIGVFKKKYPEFDFESLPEGMYQDGTPTVGGKELPNPTIIFIRRKGLSIKFHPHSILDIVRSKS